MHVSAEQDGHLRRLHLFEQLGATLAPQLQLEKHLLREWDRRDAVRAPRERTVLQSAAEHRSPTR